MGSMVCSIRLTIFGKVRECDTCCTFETDFTTRRCNSLSNGIKRLQTTNYIAKFRTPPSHNNKDFQVTLGCCIGLPGYTASRIHFWSDLRPFPGKFPPPLPPLRWHFLLLAGASSWKKQKSQAPWKLRQQQEVSVALLAFLCVPNSTIFPWSFILVSNEFSRKLVTAFWQIHERPAPHLFSHLLHDRCVISSRSPFTTPSQC